jgi:hypothetical protein
MFHFSAITSENVVARLRVHPKSLINNTTTQQHNNIQMLHLAATLVAVLLHQLVTQMKKPSAN